MGKRILSQVRFLFIACVALLALSCGGGGGSGDGGTATSEFTPADADTQMTTDQNNVVTAVGLVRYADSVANMTETVSYLPLQQKGASEDANAESALLRAIVKQIAEQLPNGDYQAMATAPVSETCPFGGSMRGSLQWDGTNANPYYCDLINLRGSMTFANCGMDSGISMSGSVSIQFAGPFCQPTAMSYSLSNYTYNDSNQVMRSRNLQITAAGLYWGPHQLPYGSPVSGTFTLNGQVVATVSGASVAAAFDGYTEVLEQIDPVTRRSMLSISGNITGPCLDGWASLSTITPIQIDIAQECPIGGHLVVSGVDGSMDVFFYSGGSVTVGEDAFETCDELEISCPLT